MQKDSQNDVIVMDFAKAFDIKLLTTDCCYKLSSYRVKGNTLGWIGSFFVKSLWQVSEGCPRREIIFCSCALGPVLLLNYINDLPENISDSTVQLFVDDTILYLTNHNP